MRVHVIAMIVALPCAAAAQSARAPAVTPGAVLPSIGLPLPSIGLPLSGIGLPLPPIGLGPAVQTPTRSAEAASHRAPRPSGGQGRKGHRAPHVVYALAIGAYGWALPRVTATPSTPPAAPPVETAPAEGHPATGTLRLELLPRPTGPLYVNGAYVGTFDELGPELTMVNGVHQIEIRERGFQPFTLTVRVDAGRALVYPGDLERHPSTAPEPSTVAAPPPLAPSPPARKPFYFIPGCYLGDVPPEDAGLPASCDLSRAVVYPR